MPGLEYRSSQTGSAPTPAVDVVALDAYYTACLPGDCVKLDANGLVIKSVVADVSHYGVVVGREIIREKGDVKAVKVRIARDAIYEAAVSGGTPKIGLKCEITTDFRVNAAGVTTPSVQIQRILPGGTVLVTLL